MYASRYFLGDYLPITVQCRTSAGAPVVPDDVPTARIYKGATKIDTVKLPIIDRYQATGLFLLNYFLGTLYSTGNFVVVVTFLVSGQAFNLISYFEIVPGFSADGPIQSMFAFNRPDGTYIVRQLGRGFITAGRNPLVNQQ